MTLRKLTRDRVASRLAPVLLVARREQGQTARAVSIRRRSCKPLADSWPTYSGDYTGRRYSALTQINQTTVKNLTLAWTTTRRRAGRPARGRLRRRRGGGGGGGDVIVGGEGPDDFPAPAAPTSRAAILRSTASST